MKELKNERIVHPFPPFYQADSRILILGSFPSVKSREQHFFYGHPQNRFWKVTAAVFGYAVPQSIEEKRLFLGANQIALWDVIASCEITGSSDSSIRDAVPNDLSAIFRACEIQKVFINGKTAERLYLKYLFPKYKREAVCLPSTSPANAAWSVERLVSAWNVIKIE